MPTDRLPRSSSLKNMYTYLDNAATTRPLDEVIDEMGRIMREDYGNPSAMHNAGVSAENLIRQSRQIISKTLGAKPAEVFFTSGGTESNNMLIRGVARIAGRRGKHIITTAIEHPAVSNPISSLEEEGYEVTILPVDERGIVSLDALRDSLRDDTILVSMMHVNNEIGTIEPVSEAAKIIHEYNKEIVFHVDAIQSYGKLPIHPKHMGIDALSVSGHKIHGPKGVGFLYLRDWVRIYPLILGGGQESGMRSGTENVPAIAGLGIAAEKMCKDPAGHLDQMSKLGRIFFEELSEMEGIRFNGPYDSKYALPSIISISVEGVRAEVLLHALEEKNVYVSAGSACSTHHKHESATLNAIGLDPKLKDSTIRVSMSSYTTEDEVRYAIGAMRELIPQLRKYRSH